MVYTEHLEEVREAVAACGREVTIVAAVKMQTRETVEELMRVAPDLVLGENRVQELTAKYDPAYRWHFIGQLQTNKVKYIADKVELIHSLDRAELAKEIEKQAVKHARMLDCLVEVNMGSEISKGGVAPEEVAEFIRSMEEYPHIRVRGLMSVLPNLGELSAGMSGDYKTALRYGSNMIRLGRTLFGERIYPAAVISDGAAQ